MVRLGPFASTINITIKNNCPKGITYELCKHQVRLLESNSNYTATKAKGLTRLARYKPDWFIFIAFLLLQALNKCCCHSLCTFRSHQNTPISCQLWSIFHIKIFYSIQYTLCIHDESSLFTMIIVYSNRK